MSKDVFIEPAVGLTGEISLPGDKSVSHRAVIFGSLAEGKSSVKNFLSSEDTHRTINIMRELGVEIKEEKEGLSISGVGLGGLKEAKVPLYCGNSGTTMRLMLGILASNKIFSVLFGDDSLARRPMKRVTLPLRKMGAKIYGRVDSEYPPLAIVGKDLSGIKYDMDVSSAQVKSAILLSGMRAKGKTRIFDPGRSRDHTERMMRYFNISITSKGKYIQIKGIDRYDAKDITVPGDISSAAFFIVGALITEKSELLIKDVGFNPTRTGIVESLISMGGDISVINKREVSGEPVADIVIKSSRLRGIKIGGEIVTRMIDEIPVFAVAAAVADGETKIEGARELRVKESDRIKTTCENLVGLGIEVREFSDGMAILGRGSIDGGSTKSFGDHRVAMAAAVLGLRSKDGISVKDVDCVDTSFPGFFDILKGVTSGR